MIIYTYYYSNTNSNITEVMKFVKKAKKDTFKMYDNLGDEDSYKEICFKTEDGKNVTIYYWLPTNDFQIYAHII